MEGAGIKKIEFSLTCYWKWSDSQLLAITSLIWNAGLKCLHQSRGHIGLPLAWNSSVPFIKSQRHHTRTAFFLGLSVVYPEGVGLEPAPAQVLGRREPTCWKCTNSSEGLASNIKHQGQGGTVRTRSGGNWSGRKVADEDGSCQGLGCSPVVCSPYPLLGTPVMQVNFTLPLQNVIKISLKNQNPECWKGPLVQQGQMMLHHPLFKRKYKLRF